MDEKAAPLHLASPHRNPTIVQSLIQYGAKVNVRDDLVVGIKLARPIPPVQFSTIFNVVLIIPSILQSDIHTLQ
jgi:hypothetical protein